jgi:mannose-6-phosphate isomerase-like protein (cupin superfamily)
MMKKGTILRHTASGDTAELLETNESSGGKHLKVKYTFNPGGIKAPPHIHLQQEEHFEVVSGEFTWHCNGETKKLGSGESVFFDKAIGHEHYNGGNTPCVVIQTLSPALDFEDSLVRIYELANEGKLVNGNPPFLEAMVWLQKFEAKTYLAGVPIPVQNALSMALAPVGRALGHGGK